MNGQATFLIVYEVVYLHHHFVFSRRLFHFDLFCCLEKYSFQNELLIVSTGTGGHLANQQMQSIISIIINDKSIELVTIWISVTSFFFYDDFNRDLIVKSYKIKCYIEILVVFFLFSKICQNFAQIYSIFLLFFVEWCRKMFFWCFWCHLSFKSF